jgi:uncharacterized protein (DUF1684 family)
MTPTAITYAEEIAAWRADAEATLRADDGWLTLVGLHWLQPGTNTVGSAATSDVPLPARAPARLGELHFDGAGVTFAAAAGVDVRVNGDRAARAVLRDDSDGSPDIVRWNEISFLIITRGGRTGVRVRDNASPLRARFAGRVWFPVDTAFRFAARFVRYDPPKPLAITNILGDTSTGASPGYAEFAYAGQTYRLDATAFGERGLSFLFRDATSGQETYGAARVLTAPTPEGERLTLDFNRAVNPPCAFTAFATCPLPPGQNTLPFAVAAGERYRPPEEQA